MRRGASSKSVKPFAWLASVGKVRRRATAQAGGDETVQGVKKVKPTPDEIANERRQGRRIFGRAFDDADRPNVTCVNVGAIDADVAPFVTRMAGELRERGPQRQLETSFDR
jgi:hypothetical protein